jgi:hypothetical protein
MDSPRQTQPGFGDKLKSIFGTKSGMSPAEKEGQRDKNKSTKAGIAAVTKDKDKKDSSTMSGMPATGTDKNTESGMTPVGKESKTGMAPAASNKSSKSGMIAPTPGKSTKSGLAAIGAFFGGGKKQATHQTMPAASIASPEPTIEQPQSFVANPMDNTEASPAGSAALSASASASASPYAQPFLPEQEEDDQPVFTSLSNADLTSKIDMADYSAAAPMPDGVRAQFTAPEFTPSKPIDHYQNQPTSFVFGNKTAEKEISDISEAGGETQSETQGGAHRSPVIAEALAVPSSTAEGAESATAEEPNAFERAVAEALAAEEARAQEQAALAAERAEREAAAAARAMAEIEAGKEAEARAKAQAAAEEARLQAEREAAEVRARTAAEASERAKFEEQERISRAEREARERAEREEAERAEAQRAAQEAELARAAAEARARAEREAAEQAVAAAAAAAAAATAATAAMMKLKEEEERRHREEQAAKEAAAREAALREAEAQEAAAREFAAREAAERHAAERQAAQMAAAQQGGPEIVDTPSKLSGKASQSQLAQMVNRFSKKGTSLTPDGTGAIPAAAEFTQPALEAAQAPMVSEMSTSQAPVDDQQAKSQKKFAELAQRLKSNAAKSSEAPVAVPPPPPPAPTSVAMSQQQPFSSQGDYAGSSYGSDMRSPGSSPSDYNRNTEFQPSNLPDFDLPHTPSGFPDARTGDPGKEPVQTEAFNKKIEAVKKKIEALKANVPGNAAAAAAGGAVAGGAMRPEPDQPRVYESAPPRQSMSASSANLGAPPVNRLLEAAQRAVETGSVSRLPAQRSDDDFAPAMPPSAPAIKQSPRRDDALNDSAVREAEASRKDAARASQEAYSSFRDIGASIKSERTKSTRDVPDRARVRQSFNKQRPPGMLIGGLIVAALAVVAVFTPVKDMIPKAVTSVQNMFHPAPAAKTETVESGSTDIDELISSGKLDRARALEDKQTKSNKWTPKDSERHIKMAEKYADSDPPEYELAIEVLNKIPKKAQFYRKAKTMIRNYQVLKRRSSH